MAGMGRSQQAGFSAHAKCCGTAFGKEGSDLPFAADCNNDGNAVTANSGR